MYVCMYVSMYGCTYVCMTLYICMQAVTLFILCGNQNSILLFIHYPIPLSM